MDKNDKFVEMPLLPESDSSHGGKFDYTTAADVKAAFTTAATTVRNQAGSRSAAVSKGKEDFQGHFSDIYTTNASTAVQDAERLAKALDAVAGFVQQMIDAGHQEDARRKTDNEWVRKHNKMVDERSHHNWIERRGDDVHDFFASEEERPNAKPIAPPKFKPVDTSAGPRQNPAPGAGGGGGGTSSARPSNLRSFASTYRALNDDLKGTPGKLTGQLEDFKAQCYWGQIEASGVVTSVSNFLTANEHDAAWASILADAFAAAGGEGNVSTVSDAGLSEALAASGVNEQRTSLYIDPPTAAGAMPSTGYANDPVNTATGNFIEPETDLAFSGLASSLALSRMYNSLPSGLSVAGVFGPGWASVLDQRIVLDAEGARWVKDDGRAVDFPREGSGWGRGAGENFWLATEPADSASLSELGSVPAGATELLVVRDNAGSWWAFTNGGVWLGAGSGPGRTVSAHRDQTGVVTRLDHVFGRYLDVAYTGNLVAVVTSSAGQRVEYLYDQAGRLTQVQTQRGTRVYRWNDAGLIDQVTSAAGVVEATNTYDADGRVIGQLTQHGRQTRFAYLPGRVTVVSDENGERSNSWIADAKGRLVGVLDSHDQRQSMAYDRHGNLVAFTERDGSVTVHAYDERGRKIRTVTPEGADVTYGYDDADRVTTVVTAAGGVIEYSYAGETDRDPCRIKDAMGGISELSWERGLLTRVTGPTGVVVTFSYDSFGDLVATTDAAGNVARIQRDAAGRPVAAISPLGARTELTYDDAGALVSRRSPDGAVYSFEHDAASRTTAVVDPLGARTELQYGPQGEVVATIDPLGRTIERVFDDLGNVSETILPDGARWAFSHDSLSRLTGITDPAGGVWGREYDGIGELTGVVDPTGVRAAVQADREAGTASLQEAFSASTFKFDSYGRPVSVTGEDGSSELTTYDAAGNPVELVDGEGGLTRLERDLAGKIIRLVSPSGAQTSFEYDLCGRPWRSTDPIGAVTELRYDADSRVTCRVLPGGDEETFTYDAAGRLIQRKTPGEGISRFGYDLAGRLTFVQDPWYGTRRLTYNAAGELITTRNGVGGRTSFSYDARGRLVKVVDPVGGVTTRTYTALDGVDSVTDPLGRVTTATYDAAGRQLSQTDPDGHVTRWAYDEAGRQKSWSVDGRIQSEISRDLNHRRAVITDYTANDGAAVEHELLFNRRGELVSRSRGGAGLAWEYDADGHRTAFVDAQGVRTSYSRDAAGRVVGVQNARLGKAVFGRDVAGRLTSCVAGALRQEWVYREGFLAEHTRGELGGATAVTMLGYDESGRVSQVAHGGEVTEYSYDGAGQLVGALTRGGGQGAEAGLVAESAWVYDQGGRLLEEVVGQGVRKFSYDDAGELVSVSAPDGSVTRFLYDGLGRRTQLVRPDGTRSEYAWSAAGYLTATHEVDSSGVSAAGHQLWVDALGELAEVDGAAAWWDTASAFPGLVGLGQEQVLSLPGGVTGFGDQWATPGWRSVRGSGGQDPWAVIGAASVADPISGVGVSPAGAAAVLPAGVAFTASGGVSVADLEWMGARVYDPAARGFLSTDPLQPTLGAGWDGNPYSFAGNNPVGLSDPLGLKPLSDQDLKSFDDSSRSWLSKNWEYVAGGAMVLGGGLLMATGVGGPLGMALVGAGADVIIQKATTGSVNWGEVAVSGALGLVMGPVAGKVGGLLVKGGSKLVSTVAPRAVTAIGKYGSEMASRGAAALGNLGTRAGNFATHNLSRFATENPSASTVAIGRWMPGRVIPFAEEHGFGYYKGTPKLIHNPMQFAAEKVGDISTKWGNKMENVLRRVDLGYNRMWINSQVNAGKRIVDIGVDEDSPFYQIERQAVDGYSNYVRDFQPNDDLRSLLNVD